MSKRLRARVNLGRDKQGKPVYKWASAYSQEELDALAAQVAALEEQTAQVQAQVNESAAALESSRQQLAATRSEL